MTELQQYIIKTIGCTQSQWEAFAQKLQPKYYSAKTIITRQGQIQRYIYFIQQGLLRTYYIKDGKEISTYFACDGQLISSYSSFLSQKPSLEYVEVLQNSTLYTLCFNDLQQLYKTHPIFERFGRILAEKNYLCVMHRTLSMQSQSAKEKYLHFIATTDKKIRLQISQQHIASYLGITPESLSRIKKQLIS